MKVVAINIEPENSGQDTKPKIIELQGNSYYNTDRCVESLFVVSMTIEASCATKGLVL